MIVDSLLLGQRLRRARENKGISQEELAALVGTDQRAISELEHGKRRLPVTELPEFAQALDVTMFYFLEDVYSATDLDVALLKQFHRLPDIEIQKAIVEMLRVLSGAMEKRLD